MPNNKPNNKARNRLGLPAELLLTGRSALFLDVDGTLLDIAPTPDAVEIPADLLDTLSSLQQTLDGALAVISGRTIADLDRLFHPLVLPAAGQHGFELRLDAGPIAQPGGTDTRLAAVRARLADLTRAYPKIIVEDKSHTIAIHFRATPADEEPLRRQLNLIVGEIPDRPLLLAGKMVFEIRPAGINKGTAIEFFMRHTPFAGRAMVFIGDDRTDEDGFRAVKAGGGLAVRIGSLAGSAADCALNSPQQLRAWLKGEAARLARRGA
ncbi:MAG: trehalose-phosphatase [Rhodospirillales bacterium]|nr:trehalose-phosphatase [Rhodospirillales bacterium]